MTLTTEALKSLETNDYELPLTILCQLCDRLINTTGLVTARIELALSKPDAEKENSFREALRISQRGLLALTTMDILLRYLQKDARQLLMPLNEAALYRQRLTKPLNIPSDAKSVET